MTFSYFDIHYFRLTIWTVYHYFVTVYHHFSYQFQPFQPSLFPTYLLDRLLTIFHALSTHCSAVPADSICGFCYSNCNFVLFLNEFSIHNISTYPQVTAEVAYPLSERDKQLLSTVTEIVKKVSWYIENKCMWSSNYTFGLPVAFATAFSRWK